MPDNQEFDFCASVKAYKDAIRGNDADAQDRLLRKLVEAALAAPHDPASGFKDAIANLKTDATPDTIANAIRKAADKGGAELPPLPPAPFKGATWEAVEPPPREWLIKDLIPAHRLSSLHGVGAAGKSALALQIAAAVMHGGAALPVDPLKPILSKDERESLMANNEICLSRDGGGRVLWLSWEDETDELIRRWRMARAAKAINADFPDPDKLTLIDMRKEGAIWAPEGGVTNRQSTWTPAGQRFLKTLKGHTLAIIDPLAAAYADNESDRNRVRPFCAALDGASQDAECTTLLIAHPPKTEGAGYSGSTDWRAAVRSMLMLECSDKTGFQTEGEDARPAKAWRLRNDKANYSAEAPIIWLRRHWKAPEDGNPAQLAWYATTAKRAAEAQEGCRVTAAEGGTKPPAKPRNRRGKPPQIDGGSDPIDPKQMEEWPE